MIRTFKAISVLAALALVWVVVGMTANGTAVASNAVPHAQLSPTHLTR